MSHLTKTETPLVIWLNSVTHMRGDVHDTRQYIAKYAENAASVYNTCLDKIVCYLQRIFNRNQKPETTNT